MHVRFVFVFQFNLQAESFVFKGDHFDFQAVFSESIRIRGKCLLRLGSKLSAGFGALTQG